MESVAIRDIESMFGYIQALKDVGIITDETYQKAFKHLWDVRAILNVALNDYEYTQQAK
jgi:argininosuccinate lyase